MTTPSRPGENTEDRRPPVVIRDKRRIDPETLQLRPGVERPATHKPSGQGEQGAGSTAGTLLGGGATSTPDQAPTGAGGESLRATLAERTRDLQRVKAEYDNYRRRVQRERLAIREGVMAEVLRTLLPVLDTIDRARTHQDTAAAFDTVAASLQNQLAALGLQQFGTEGEPFDPTLHEALSSTESDRADHPTCTHILRPGYRLGEILLRPAQVAVEQPHPDQQASGSSSSERTGPA
ncbi:nucleotide exchange factor GrpE [Kitasatospora purpeofusca]|uniref:nucleotide exchange factor GrpE n=1 Tax=Kitasatospora purpeofusca TaxID=67352 RepID=UPI00056A8E0B|nr:nucleotide exchange factor GrpE [Kitasatospora purpeofusca]